jgi:hypothetical protein
MKLLRLILLLALSLPACSHFSESARRQRSYEKYIQKSMTMRKKQQNKISKNQAKIPSIETSPASTSMSAEDPQAFSSGEADQ